MHGLLYGSADRSKAYESLHIIIMIVAQAGYSGARHQCNNLVYLRSGTIIIIWY